MEYRKNDVISYELLLVCVAHITLYIALY